MMKSLRFFLCMFILGSFTFSLYSGEAENIIEEKNEDKKVDMTFSGAGITNFGQIHKAFAKASSQNEIRSSLPYLTKKILSNWQLWLNLDLKFTEKFSAYLGGGGLVNFDMHAGPEGLGKGTNDLLQGKKTWFGITQSYIKYDLGDIETPPLSLYLGYMPYKYSPDANHFGNYMFSTQLYPCLVYSMGGHDKVLGARVGSVLFDSFKQDLLFTSETEHYPYFDYSLTYIASYKLFNVFELGVGGSLWRFIPAYGEYTTPAENDAKRRALSLSGDTTVSQRLFYTDGSDTIYYTFQGTKVMARFSFDIKNLFKTDIFGENDLKLYGEAIVLGMKDYNKYYEEIMERIPMMIGFNIPTFKILNLLGVEFEYYEWPYSTSISELVSDGYPTPYDPNVKLGPGVDTADVLAEIRWYEELDNFKFSVHASKDFGDHLTTSFRLTRDHTRFADFNGKPEEVENFYLPEHWYYYFTLMYKF